MGEKTGEMYVTAFLATAVIDLVEFFNIGKTMGEEQVMNTVELIREEFWMLKPDDFKLCFNRAKKGHYGKVYDRLDGQVIMGWLRDYLHDRTEFAVGVSLQKHSRVQAENRNSQYDRQMGDARQLEEISRMKSGLMIKKHNNGS